MLFLKVYLIIGMGFAFLILLLFEKFKYIDRVAEGIESMKKSIPLSIVMVFLLIIGWLPMIIIATSKK